MKVLKAIAIIPLSGKERWLKPFNLIGAIDDGTKTLDPNRKYYYIVPLEFIKKFKYKKPEDPKGYYLKDLIEIGIIDPTSIRHQTYINDVQLKQYFTIYE